MKDGLQRKKNCNAHIQHKISTWSNYMYFTGFGCLVLSKPTYYKYSLYESTWIKYYSLIRLSRVQNMCRLHTCFYLSVISIQNVLDCKLSRKILNSCSIGIHTVLHCVSYKFVRRHSDKWRVWEVKMCVQSGWNLSVWYHTDDLDKWPLFGTYIVYIITNLLISKHDKLSLSYILTVLGLWTMFT